MTPEERAREALGTLTNDVAYAIRLAVADEREACARLAESRDWEAGEIARPISRRAGERIAIAIRARGVA